MDDAVAAEVRRRQRLMKHVAIAVLAAAAANVALQTIADLVGAPPGGRTVVGVLGGMAVLGQLLRHYRVWRR